MVIHIKNNKISSLLACIPSEMNIYTERIKIHIIFNLYFFKSQSFIKNTFSYFTYLFLEFIFYSKFLYNTFYVLFYNNIIHMISRSY